MSKHSDSYVKKILSARVYDLVVETPIDTAPRLSKRLNNQVLFKREDLQPVFSFKCRGAYNRLLQLSDAERATGVIAASAGNHAQGLALGAKTLGIKATIVMPKTTPAIKVDAVRSRGAKVVLIGDNYDAAAAHAQQLVAEKGLVYIHPFDDPDVIAGQGTCGMEILRQLPGDLDAIFVPVGGGGLCAGIAAYVNFVRPEVKVIAVEPADAACLEAAMNAGRRVKLPEVGIFADGTAVAQVGKENFKVMRDTVHSVVTVSTDEICAAIKDIYDDSRSISEPSGALAVAGMKKYVEQQGVSGQVLVAINSGANINFDRLRYISERTEVGEKREAILAVTIDERPGSFRAFCRALHKRNVTEFNYRFASERAANIFVGVQVSGDSDREALVGELVDSGYAATDLTDNDIAKAHIRHMVGGQAPQAGSELVFSFEFPERPGALSNFLNQLGGRWNISMFHYRNHGAAYGRVLVAMQAEHSELKALSKFLDGIGYPWTNETDNPACQFFLSH